MSVSTLDLGPVLASELPPAPPVPSPLHAARAAVTAWIATRMGERRFERAWSNGRRST